MAIYNIFDFYEKVHTEKIFDDNESARSKIDPSAFRANRIDESFIPKSANSKDLIFSAIAARLFFFLLLVADIAWGFYSLAATLIKLSLALLTFFQLSPIKTALAKSYLSLKRSIVCALALFIAIFSPALGIMFSCMYFIMYDKAGVDEVVPSSLRDQFKELFPSSV